MKLSAEMKRISVLLTCLMIFTVVHAQKEPEVSRIEQLEQQVKMQDESIKVLQKLKVSGYIQPQFQYGGGNAALKVGAANEIMGKPFNRIGIRSGRIKFSYEDGIASGVFLPDITDEGVALKDVYLNVKDPWIGTNALRVGVFDRPFGDEISYSSSMRESPELSIIFQTFFPEESDLGGMLTLQPSKTSPWHFLKLDAGFFAGNGIKQETDNRKDFIGHLYAAKNIRNYIDIGFGVSYYNGGVYQGTENVYTMIGKAFVLNSDASNIGQFAKREYFGVDGQFNIMSSLGKMKLRGEYLWGTQPGSISGSKSPNSSTLPSIDTYLRNFNGGYLIFVQDIGASPFSAVLKYDWYDPNTKVAANEIGLNGTNKGDITYKTFGFGFLWRVTDSVRMQAYYELMNNEKSENLNSYDENLEDDVFTLRLQYKF